MLGDLSPIFQSLSSSHVSQYILARTSKDASYQKKCEGDHILLWPESYIRSVNKEICEGLWIYEDELMKKWYVFYSSGFLKILDELIMNLVDKKQIDPSMHLVKV
ncbi:hypothetical protein ARALYDRAFT_899319 [Arabidopsis lyrata subsp. lyrata]|uniref:DNA topoisomerase (ATP-hydrolyzing) n=1 Tax=Arabidopsis lyrata subsp. lyrata TaxID=81972 RepID=D7L8M0_ARALL|nr:hypothetical protein ARALYDRAFT_899319 [Arabidopsis lyrata subsp. lyrata]